jgi:hypothetical protein
VVKDLKSKQPVETSVDLRDTARDGRDASALLVSELGWTMEKAAAVRASLLSFEEDWDAVGMEDYDQL